METTQPTVAATGDRRRLRALVWRGHDYATLASHLAVDAATVEQLTETDYLPHWEDRIPYRLSARIRMCYDRLWDKPGTSQHARAHARNRGWVSPLAWDDDEIDDPAAQPQVDAKPPRRADYDHAKVALAVAGVPVTLNRGERREAVKQLWTDPDHTVARIIRRTGASPDAVWKAAERGRWPKRGTTVGVYQRRRKATT